MLQFNCNSTPIATLVAVLKACSELRASRASCDKSFCKAISLWVLDIKKIGREAGFALAYFLMTVCSGCALEVGGKV